MTVMLKELKYGFKTVCIWTGAIGLMLVLCVALFPEMKGQMNDLSGAFSNMGSFSSAFGMDKIAFGSLMGFYGIECGNVLGIGGGFFSAYIGIVMLSKEEKDRTAEFLLTHPVSRASVVAQKLVAIIIEILAMNTVITGASALAVMAIGEKLAVREFLLLHLAFLILQVEIACVCFGISAFIKRGSVGIGLGLTAILYFMNLICNISADAKALKYITPFAYTEASDIIIDGKLALPLIAVGGCITLVGVAVAFVKYTKKDLVS